MESSTLSTMSDVISVDKFYSKSSQQDLTRIKHLAEMEAIGSSKMQVNPYDIYTTYTTYIQNTVIKYIYIFYFVKLTR